MLPLQAKQIKTEAAGYCNACGCTSEGVVGGTIVQSHRGCFLCCGRVLVGHKLGEFVGRTWVWARRLLTHPKESLLLPFLQV